MASRKERAKIARETLSILKEGSYSIGDDGKTVNLFPLPEAETFYPDSTLSLSDMKETSESNMTVSLWNIGTINATRKLREELGEDAPIGVLNFASSKNPGGGFLKGSRAQEENVCKCSNLYASIQDSDMYKYHSSAKHRNKGLYAHYAIFSPDVTIFRDDESFDLLSQPIKANFVSCPAVNAQVAMEHHQSSLVNDTMLQRMERIIQLFAFKGQKNLILGAYGCGVFGNSAMFVAQAFKKLLHDYQSHFDRVIFTIPGNGINYKTFEIVTKDTDQDG